MIFNGDLSTRQPRKESVTIQLQLRDHHFEIASRVSDYFVSIPSYHPVVLVLPSFPCL